METYTPTYPPLVRVWNKLSEELKTERLLEARRREKIVAAVAGRAAGQSERAAIKELAKADRTTFRRWQERYGKWGLDGLIETRLPPRAESLPDAAREAIRTLRRVDPNCAVEAIILHVERHHHFRVGGTTVRLVLREAGLARPTGPPAGDSRAGETRLALAGMKLVEVAAVKTGYVEALARAVVTQAEVAPTSPVSPVDTSGRDDFGRFEAAHNERYRKKPGDLIGPGYASVQSTRVGKDPERFHLSQVGPDIIERKVWALMVSPLLGGGRWDGIRVARGDLLGELCGYPYMPATLDLFTRELKFLGISNTWWEIHARLWYAQTRHWGDARTALVLYVDETNKPVWTELFSQASKVSQTGRVMPSMEIVAFHSGYGVPLWQVTHSGRAPLVREVPVLLNQLRGILGGAEIGRIVVIDAEGNSIPFLKGLEAGDPHRGWVTRLRPSWVEDKKIFNRTNYRAYRDGDRIRAGVADFNDPAGGTFRMRVVEIERRTTGAVTYLGASTHLPERDWSATELSDLYFERWPHQEANFRAVNQAVGSKEVHGYGKQLIDNVAVVTQLDDLNNGLAKLATSCRAQKSELLAAAGEVQKADILLRRRERRLVTVTATLETRIAKGQRITPALKRLSKERTALGTEVVRLRVATARQSAKLDKLSARHATTNARIDQGQAQLKELESRRHIFRHDVELDSTFALLKVGLVLLVTYVLKELLGDARMEPVTFLERLATLPGRLRQTPTLEIVTFDYNHRDPEIMALLDAHAEAINALQLPTRGGRVLRIAVDPAPPPRRPPPPHSRTNTARRFHP